MPWFGSGEDVRVRGSLLAITGLWVFVSVRSWFGCAKGQVARAAEVGRRGLGCVVAGNGGVDGDPSADPI